MTKRKKHRSLHKVYNRNHSSQLDRTLWTWYLMWFIYSLLIVAKVERWEAQGSNGVTYHMVQHADQHAFITGQKFVCCWLISFFRWPFSFFFFGRLCILCLEWIWRCFSKVFFVTIFDFRGLWVTSIDFENLWICARRLWICDYWKKEL